MGIITSLLPMLEPYLDKVPNTLEEIDKKYGVTDSMWLLRRRYDEESGKTIASLEFMYSQEFDKSDGTKGYRMASIKDENEQPIRYQIKDLIGLITGGATDEEED